ncbi:C40 family peptidase [Streptomyces poonensis]|nr:C40 family peptidase [Streptomyces poonensis]
MRTAVRTAAVATAATVLVVTVSTAAVPDAAVPGPQRSAAERSVAGRPVTERSVAGLLTELRRLYRKAEAATEAYNAAEEDLAGQRAEVRRLDRELTEARLLLRDSRGAAGRLARQQYRSRTDLSPYLRLLLARDPRRALDEGQVIRRVSQERAGTVERLADGERRADALARAARRALDEQLSLAGRRKEKRDDVRERLREVEELLASLSDEELGAIAALEREETAGAQHEFLASGALGAPGDAPDDVRPPTRSGAAALRYAVEQIGKPYAWGAEGPDAYDCSGLTSRAWAHAARPVPRTSQEQWGRLPRVPLDRLRPGDLVVYFPEATHVALYLGGGLVVHAPRPGARVKVSPVAANPVLGAVRPDPWEKSLQWYTPPALPEGALDGPDDGPHDGPDEGRAGAVGPVPATEARRPSPPAGCRGVSPDQSWTRDPKTAFPLPSKFESLPDPQPEPQASLLMPTWVT